MIGLCREMRVFIKLKGGTAREASIFETSHTPFLRDRAPFLWFVVKEVAQLGSTFCLLLPYKLVKLPVNGLAYEQPGVALNSLNGPLFIVFDSTCLWTMDTVLPFVDRHEGDLLFSPSDWWTQALLWWLYGRIAKVLWMWMKMLRGQSNTGV